MSRQGQVLTRRSAGRLVTALNSAATGALHPQWRINGSHLSVSGTFYNLSTIASSLYRRSQKECPAPRIEREKRPPIIIDQTGEERAAI
ncbi:hypothetical protein TBK1r_39790 [Stieleria magnilauensis]|uniref:Uncharacterized protein n=1 Tax=Stieleria magnilauensis TaxID=2527963 RepID=A0ABX5XUD9_9BACT|nr:hypothetical protein TBK1r_39790 [Planctomycetes bacterium TBK1r]